MSLRIWASRAHRVDVLVGETRMPATQDRDGWWEGAFFLKAIKNMPGGFRMTREQEP